MNLKPALRGPFTTAFNDNIDKLNHFHLDVFVVQNLKQILQQLVILGVELFAKNLSVIKHRKIIKYKTQTDMILISVTGYYRDLHKGMLLTLN